MAWYTFTIPAHTAAGAEKLPPHVAFERLWHTSLFRSAEACLLVGAPTLRGQAYYLSIPEAGEDILQAYLQQHRAQPLSGVPEGTEVRVLVGHEHRAVALWEERITCSRENPDGCVMCSG